LRISSLLAILYDLSGELCSLSSRYAACRGFTANLLDQ